MKNQNPIFVIALLFAIGFPLVFGPYALIVSALIVGAVLYFKFIKKPSEADYEPNTTKSTQIGGAGNGMPRRKEVKR
jgi:hypothetical protein